MLGGGRRRPGHALLAVDFRVKFCGFWLAVQTGPFAAPGASRASKNASRASKREGGGWGLDRGRSGGLSFRHSVILSCVNKNSKK